MTIWRVQVTEQPIQRLDFLAGEQEMLAASTRTEIIFLDAQSGERVGDYQLDHQRRFDDRDSDDWRAFIGGLRAPNGAVLPLVRLAHGTIHSGISGGMHLLSLDARRLIFEANGKATDLAMPADATLAAVGLDRVLGLIAALDSSGKLHLYQQRIRIGVFDLGLSLDEGQRPAVLVSHEGTAVFVSDGQRIVLTNAGGKVRRRFDLHYAAGETACSSDGRLLAVTEDEIGVIRVYDGVDFRPLRQRFAIDLLTEVRRPPLRQRIHVASIGVNALAINPRGRLAFALAGVVCMSSIGRMKAFPTPE